MRFILFCLALLVSVASQALHAETIAIRNVAVVDVATGKVSPGQTVVVADGTIRSVTRTARGRIANARVIDGTGRYLIPGLWDMGSFVLNGRYSGVPGAFELMIAHGVTGTRDLETTVPPNLVKALVREIETGKIAGPRLIWTTKALSRNFQDTKPPAITSRLDLQSEAAAVAAVDRAAAEGAHYLRVHQNFPEQWLAAVIARARHHRMSVTGAIVSSWKRAAAEGLAGFEHFVDLYRSTARLPERDQYLRLYRDPDFRRSTANSRDAMYAFFTPFRRLRDEPYYRSTLTQLVQSGTPVTTNMATMFWAQQEIGAQIDQRRIYAYPEGPQPPSPPGALEGKATLFGNLRDFRAAGIPIMAGTIADGSPRELPGATLLDELEFLGKAGFTPREALAAATITPGREIARLFPRVRASQGIRADEPADLVLLDANPLTDIANVRRIHGVMAAGRWYDPTERQALLDRAKRLAATAPAKPANR